MITKSGSCVGITVWISGGAKGADAINASPEWVAIAQNLSQYKVLYNGMSLMDKLLLVTLLTVLPGMATAATSKGSSAASPTKTAKSNEPQLVVTANPPADKAADALAGAGFISSDIELGPSGNKARLDTPFSTTTLSQQMIASQQAQSVSELLKYTPSAQMQARGGMDVGRPQSRGMQGSVVANSRLDGLNIVSTTAFPVEMLERLDVINSLTGALYGPASPAGQFNFIAKRPTSQRLNRLTLGYQSRSAWNGHADLGGYFDDENLVGYRLNLLNEDGEGSVDNNTRRRKLISLALDFTLQPGTLLQLDASHYEFLQKGYVGGFSYAANIPLPAAPNPKNKNFTLPTAGNDLTTDTVSSHLIHYFNDEWSLTAGLGFQQADRAMRSVANSLIDSQGTITRSLNDSAAAGRFRVLSNNLALSGHVNTGRVGHDLAFATSGSAWSIFSAKEASQRYNLGSSSINSPTAMQDPTNGRINKNGSRYKSSENRQQSVTAGDTLTFTPQWSAMIYLSQSWLNSRNFSRQGTKTSQVNENGLSPSAALMYKVTPSLMAYLSYADSLEQGGSAPLNQGVKNEGQTLAPYRSQQYEAGLKASVGGLDLGSALFWLSRPFAYVDPTDMLYKEQGKQVNRGLELTASGNLWQGLNIYSGVTFLDPRLKNTVSARTRNKRVVGVPKAQANVLMEYSLPSMPELVYSANIHYTGKRAASDTNISWAGSYTTLDLGGRYITTFNNVPTTLRLTFNNLTNKRYWASIYPSDRDGSGGSASAFPGAGRQVRAAVTFDF